MALSSWDWDIPDPVLADTTLIRASHLNDLRDAVDDTRQNIPDASSLIAHASNHKYSGSDPIIGTLYLSNNESYLLNGLSMSSDPISFHSYISNNIYKNASGWQRLNAAKGASIMKIEPDNIYFGYMTTSGISPSYTVDIDTLNGNIDINGDLSTYNLNINNNLEVSGNAIIDGDLVITGEISNINPLTFEQINVGSGGISSIGNITTTDGSFIGNECNIIKGIFGGIKITPNDSSDMFQQSIQAYGLSDTTHKLCTLVQNTIGDTNLGFRLLLTADGDSYQRPRNILNIDAETLKLQTMNLSGSTKLLIGNGSTGLSSPSDFGDYSNIDINNNIMIYDRGTNTSQIRVIPSTSAHGDIGIHDDKGMAIRGISESGRTSWLNNSMSGEIYFDGTPRDRVLELYDQVIISNGHGNANWIRYDFLPYSLKTTSSAYLWAPFCDDMNLVVQDGAIMVGTRLGSSLAIGKRGIQSRNANTSGATHPGTLSLNQFGGDVRIGNPSANNIYLNFESGSCGIRLKSPSGQPYIDFMNDLDGDDHDARFVLTDNDTIELNDASLKASFQSTSGNNGIDRIISFPDQNGMIHTLTFEDGILTNYQYV